MPSSNSNITEISELTPFFFWISQEKTLKRPGSASISTVNVMRQNRHHQIQLCFGTSMGPRP